MEVVIVITLLVALFPSNTLAHLKGAKVHEEFKDQIQVLERKDQARDSSSMNNIGPSPEELCAAFMIYDFVTRKMQRESSSKEKDRNNIDWSAACPPLQSLNPKLCPTGKYLHDICTEPYRVDLNPSVQYDYCEPTLARIEDDKDRLDCVTACVKYVSRDRGDCCRFKCE